MKFKVVGIAHRRSRWRGRGRAYVRMGSNYQGHRLGIADTRYRATASRKNRCRMCKDVFKVDDSRR